MEHVDRAAVSTYTDAAAELLAIPLETADRAVVIAVMERLAGYAHDIALAELPRDGEA
jgi:hypothetical protein